MAQTDLKVVRVMRGGYLNDAGTEVYLDIIIGNNRVFRGRPAAE